MSYRDKLRRMQAYMKGTRTDVDAALGTPASVLERAIARPRWTSPARWRMELSRRRRLRAEGSIREIKRSIMEAKI